MLWGPLTKEEEGDPTGKTKKSEVIASCFLCPFLPKQTSSLRQLRAEIYRHYASKHFKADLLSFLTQTPPCPCPICPVPKSGSKSSLSSGALARHLAVKHGMVEAYLPPQFHIDTGGHSGGKIGEKEKEGIAEAIQRAIENGVALAKEKKEASREPDTGGLDPTREPSPTCLPTFTCTECSETSGAATRRQVYLHYAVNHCQEKVTNHT